MTELTNQDVIMGEVWRYSPCDEGDAWLSRLLCENPSLTRQQCWDRCPDGAWLAWWLFMCGYCEEEGRQKDFIRHAVHWATCVLEETLQQQPQAVKDVMHEMMQLADVATLWDSSQIEREKALRGITACWASSLLANGSLSEERELMLFARYLGKGCLHLMQDEQPEDSWQDHALYLVEHMINLYADCDLGRQRMADLIRMDYPSPPSRGNSAIGQTHNQKEAVNGP